jgi:hypothetical protein
MPALATLPEATILSLVQTLTSGQAASRSRQRSEQAQSSRPATRSRWDASNGSDFVRIFGLGAAGATNLCRNANNEISTCSSSLRYKTNINSFGSGLNIINALNPITFNWKDGGMRDMGLVAEEVAAVEPLLTTTNDKGEIEGVKYDRVGVVLVNAVKEQQAQIESQQDQIRKQNEQIEKQKIQLQQQQGLIEGLIRVVCKNDAQADVCKEKK